MPRGCFRAIVQPIEVGGLRQKGFWVSGGLRVVDSVWWIRSIERESKVKATVDAIIRGREKGH